MKKAGRKPVPKHAKRLPCHAIRLQAYWIYWLSQHKRVGGRMIEEALRAYFMPDENEIIEEFYERENYEF